MATGDGLIDYINQAIAQGKIGGLLVSQLAASAALADWRAAASRTSDGLIDRINQAIAKGLVSTIPSSIAPVGITTDSRDWRAAGQRTSDGLCDYINAMIALGRISTGLTPPNLSALGLWYDAQNIDGSNNGSLVNLQTLGTWKNLGSLGAAGDVLQATAGLRPQYVAVASAGKLNNKSCVRSDGARTMQSGALTTLAQPSLIAVVAMTTTIGAGICDIVDGRTAARNILGRNGAPFLAFANSFVTPVGSFVAGTYHGVNLNFNGAASIGRFDGGASGAVDPGASGLDGVTLFSDLAAGSLWTGDIIELLVYNGGGQPTAAQVEAYFTTRYGATPQ